MAFYGRLGCGGSASWRATTFPRTRSIGLATDSTLLTRKIFPPSSTSWTVLGAPISAMRIWRGFSGACRRVRRRLSHAGASPWGRREGPGPLRPLGAPPGGAGTTRALMPSATAARTTRRPRTGPAVLPGSVPSAGAGAGASCDRGVVLAALGPLPFLACVGLCWGVGGWVWVGGCVGCGGCGWVCGCACWVWVCGLVRVRVWVCGCVCVWVCCLGPPPGCPWALGPLPL